MAPHLTPNEAFIQQHRTDDVRSLALKKVPQGVDPSWCLQQIEGWQLARKKLPRWAAHDALWFPPRLSMEQCSSEATAEYKCQLAKQCNAQCKLPTRLVDLTGGLGIDFSYLAQAFTHATYVEPQTVLCEIAQHNLPLLGLPEAQVINASSEDYLQHLVADTVTPSSHNVFYLDPARRDEKGHKVAALEDCTPNLLEIQDLLLSHARYVIVKLSPMLDITQALRQLKCVRQVHILSLQGECKEILLVLSQSNDCTSPLLPPLAENENAIPIASQSLTYHCVNLNTHDNIFHCTEEERCSATPHLLPCDAPLQGYLFEPNASMLKAGVQDLLCTRHTLYKLHSHSNLFVGTHPIEGFPGRQFAIEHTSDFSKKALKALLGDLVQANLTIRNFPSTVAELRKRLKLKEGGHTYLFATTLHDGSHTLIRAHKVESHTGT